MYFGTLAGDLGCFPLDNEAYPPLSDCREIPPRIRSLMEVGNRSRPLTLSVLYPRMLMLDASPKAISRRTSYIRVRLEFLRYPQLITDYFNRRVFGPPQRFTAASTCPWVGRSVSGLRHATKAPCSDSLSLRLRYLIP